MTAEFFWRMEDILDLYAAPYAPQRPVVCLDERPVQLLDHVHPPQPVAPGRARREDYEYERCGTCNLFLAFEPGRGWREVIVTEQRTAHAFAQVMKRLVDEVYPEAEGIRVVLDNLNIHTPAAFYQTFGAEEARRLTRKREFHYTPKHASWLNMVEIEFSIFQLYLDSRKVGAAEQGFLFAQSFFQAAPNIVQMIYSNAYEGFDRISYHVPPRPVTGQIGTVRHISKGWPFVRESYSEIEITNTSSEKAAFVVIAEYGYNSRLFGLPWAYIYVLGKNDTGVFYVGTRPETWNPQLELFGSAILADTDIPAVDNPIDVYVIGNPEEQTYEAQIWVANPFNGPITATITQTLPSDVTVVSTDGVLAGSTITWEKTIAASDIVSMTVTFRYPAPPNASLSLPPATMTFVEPSSGQLLTTQSNTPSFSGLWPVMVEGYAPQGMFGVQTTIPITVTNLVNENVNGSMTVALSNTTGDKIYSNTQPFSVPSLSSRVISFILPDNLPPGFYLLEVQLSVNKVTQRILADGYRVLGSQLYLPIILKSP